MNEYQTYRVGEIVLYKSSLRHGKHKCIIRRVVFEPKTEREWGSYIISSTTDDNFFKNAGPYVIDGIMYPGNQCGSMYLEKCSVIKPIKNMDKHKMV